ncbi:hypothetical protein [Kiloniella sp.]|uniref:hypothetical protein n=1 Tax=Kiloniella sp. TaxID=1938587 RepID=UPI003B022C6D
MKLFEDPHRKTPFWEVMPVVARSLNCSRNIVLDCSKVERFGLRGQGTSRWLKDQSLPWPDQINSMSRMSSGAEIVRLGENEVLILESLTNPSDTVRDLKRKWAEDKELDSKGFDAYREESWSWLNLSGPGALQAMKNLTTLDMRERSFSNLEVAQTRAAHLDAVIIRSDHFSSPAYNLFFDTASFEFVVNVVADVFADANFFTLK